jgi:hypothetical protein
MAWLSINPWQPRSMNRSRRAARVRQLWILGLLIPATACLRSPTAPTPVSATSTAAVGPVFTNQTVNLDAKVNNAANPVEIFLEAGTYTVTPVGTDQGGAWDAWNPWGPTTCTDVTGCLFELPRKTGWLHSYEVLSPHLYSVSVDGKPLAPSPVTPTGVQSYFFKSGSSGHYVIVAEKIYPDARTALSAAHFSMFTITNAGVIGFLIPDQTVVDNVGGVSLQVASQ